MLFSRMWKSIARCCWRPGMNFLATVADERIADVRFEDRQLLVELKDGRTLGVPLAWYPRLLNATPAQRANWELTGGGYGLHWPDVDEDLSSEGLLRGAPAPGAIETRHDDRAEGTSSAVPKAASSLSSVIDRVEYSGDTRTLQIWFKGGRRYAYIGVPPEVVDVLRAAPSVGAFVNELINPLYRSERQANETRIKP